MYNPAGTKKERQATIKELLAVDSRWAIRGLLAIYKYQTLEEQNVEGVVEHNGVGFTSADGEILTSFAKQVESGRTMSQKQMVLIHKKLPKYAGQLVRIVDRKQ